MTTVILIRHGQSEANLDGVFAGQINPALTEKGLKQAELTAKYIADNYNIDKIYSSDLKRAYQTAQALSKIIDKDITASENLREIYAGKWEGVDFLKLKELYKEDFSIWLSDLGRAVCTGGEAVKEMGNRVVSELTSIAQKNDGKTVAVALHATPIRATQCFVETGSFDEMQNIPWVSNASVSIFTYENKMWKIVSISEDAHLGSLKTELPKTV